MTDPDGQSNLDDDNEVEKFIDAEIGDEYEVSFGTNTHRAAEFGSLMVSLRIVSNEMQDWTEEGNLPGVEEIDEKREMLTKALDETPLEDLNPESSEFDDQIVDIVEFADELVEHLNGLHEARETVDEANGRIADYVRQFELLREE